MLIDIYLPNFDVRHCHETHVEADSALAYATLRQLDLERSPIVRTLFNLRNFPSRVLGRQPAAPKVKPRSFVESALSLGWVLLEEKPGEELVMGSVTQPWAATVIFHGLPAAELAAFDKPGFTKIVWNIAARPDPGGGAIVSTETRVLATDAASRRRFRRYWFVLGPFIRLIRRIALAELKRELAHSHQPS